MIPIPSPAFGLNRKFLSGDADVALTLSAPDAPALMAALRSSSQAPIPAGNLVLGAIEAKAGGEGPIGFAGGAGTVAVSGQGKAAFGLGVYADVAAAIRDAAPDPELAATLKPAQPDATRFLVLRASYDLAAAAKGSVALAAGASVTFGLSGKSEGGLAVLHRFGDAEPAVKVFKDLFESWGLPRRITEARDLAPGTWLIAEVDGSVAMQMGVQAGYDFTWVREIPGGALQGDIGLRIQLGASAALGFEAEGKYAVVLARESADEVLRLCLYKMARKGETFAFDARAGIKAELPPFFAQPHKAEDLVAAVFGLHETQVIEVLRETRAFVSSDVSLEDKLAGVLMDLGGTALEKTTGLTEAQIREAYEAGRTKVTEFLAKWDKLEKTGGHDLTGMLLSLAKPDLAMLPTLLQSIAGTANEDEVQKVVSGLVSRAGFERTLAGRIIEAAAGPALGALADTEIAKKLQSVAGDTLAVLDGDALQKLLDFLRREICFDQILKVANETDFDRLDNLLKARIAAFLGKQKLLMADLNQVQEAIRGVLARVDQFYDAALQAAKRKQEVAFTSRYARSSTGTALVDLSFDTSDAVARESLAKAIGGDLDEILLTEKAGVTIHAAELTHNISRNVSTQLTMPFGAISESSTLLSSAGLTAQEDNGRVLVYTLETTDTEADRSRLFRARSARDSTLTIAATLPLAVGRSWKENTVSYAYRMERAVLKMRAGQLREEMGPVAEQYLPAAFAASGFPGWAADLDQVLALGDTLITLDLVAPPACLRAWNRAAAKGTDPMYMTLSRALQARLKELVTFYYFSDPARYKDLAAAAAPIVYSCIPVSTSIRLNDAGGVDAFNTDIGVYWDEADIQKVRAMVGAPQTANAVARRLETISAVLRGIPELADDAGFYGPDQVQTILATSLKNVPELLGSLLFLEARLVNSAVGAGLKMAEFRAAAGKKPAEALKQLAGFGEELAKTFNQTLGKHPFLSGASRPLATLLFVEAATAFDPGVAAAISALMRITVIRRGKLSVEEMTAGKIAQEMVLYEQSFVQA